MPVFEWSINLSTSPAVCIDPKNQEKNGYYCSNPLCSATCLYVVPLEHTFIDREHNACHAVTNKAQSLPLHGPAHLLTNRLCGRTRMRTVGTSKMLDSIL